MARGRPGEEGRRLHVHAREVGHPYGGPSSRRHFRENFSRGRGALRQKRRRLARRPLSNDRLRYGPQLPAGFPQLFPRKERKGGRKALSHGLSKDRRRDRRRHAERRLSRSPAGGAATALCRAPLRPGGFARFSEGRVARRRGRGGAQHRLARFLPHGLVGPYGAVGAQ